MGEMTDADWKITAAFPLQVVYRHLPVGFLHHTSELKQEYKVILLMTGLFQWLVTIQLKNGLQQPR